MDTIEIVRGVLKDIGYDRAKYGFDCATCGVLNAIHDQSPDIAQGLMLHLNRRVDKRSIRMIR